MPSADNGSPIPSDLSAAAFTGAGFDKAMALHMSGELFPSSGGSGLPAAFAPSTSIKRKAPAGSKCTAAKVKAAAADSSDRCAAAGLACGRR